MTTGEAGSEATASVSGTAENPVIHLTIPRGDTGKIDGLNYYEDPPAAPDKAAAPGSSNAVSRGDHVHPLPTAAQVGARPASWTPSAADVGAYPAGAVRTAQISIAASAWAGSGPYNTVLRIAGVTAQTDCRFDLGTTLTVLAADVAWETGAGTITLMTTKKPTGELSGRVVLMEVAT